MLSAVLNKAWKIGQRAGKKRCFLMCALTASCFAVNAAPSADTTAKAALYHAVAGNSLDVLIHTRPDQRLSNQNSLLEVLPQEAYFEAAMAWFMTRHADATIRFVEEAELGRAPLVHRGWLRLAEFHSAQGDQRLANHYFSQAEERSGSARTQSFAAYLKAQNFLADGDVEKAIKASRDIRADSSLQALVNLNIGSALINSGQTRSGLRRYLSVDDASSTPNGVLPMEVIKDHSALFSGNGWLIESRPDFGNSSLRRVRLNSIDANKALLGLGWTDISRKQDRQALAPWLHLTKGRQSDPAVQEAYLLAPFAYSRMGDYSRAIALYKKARSVYQLQMQQLKSTQYAAQSQQWLMRLAESTQGRIAEWPQHLRTALGATGAEAAFPALNQHDIASALEQYVQLRAMEQRASTWRERGIKLPTEVVRLLRNGRELQAQYADIINAAVVDQIKQERQRLEGFLNHAQYSLAESYQRLGQSPGRAP